MDRNPSCSISQAVAAIARKNKTAAARRVFDDVFKKIGDALREPFQQNSRAFLLFLRWGEILYA